MPCHAMSFLFFSFSVMEKINRIVANPAVNLSLEWLSGLCCVEVIGKDVMSPYIGVNGLD